MMVLMKLYEQRVGQSIWQKFGLDGLRRRLEINVHKLIKISSMINARNFKLLFFAIWRQLKKFYQLIQEKTALRISKIGRPSADSHNNKAASFYLKNIKEHKENNIPEEDDLKD
jgi:hypothetical protein